MRLRQKTADPEKKIPDLTLYLEKYQFKNNQLKLGSEISVGSFGFICKGYAIGIVPDGSETEVCVEMVRKMSNDGVRLYDCDDEVRFNLTQFRSIS